MQVETDIAPGLVEYLPAGHGMHDDEWMLPCVVEYVPAEQVWHANAAQDSLRSVPARAVASGCRA